ncbi:MAG: GntR family transcriptional regulator [Dysosmobacter sp.]
MTSCANCIYCVCTVRTEDFHGTHYPQYNSGQPIYDQITAQIKAQILRDALRRGKRCPPSGGWHKDLRISVITTKRAYDELEAGGLLNTVAGKGCFVAEQESGLCSGSR